jgi:DNA topoisomerase III
VVPTPAGLQVFQVLREAAPALVDPGTTAIWEMRLDDVVLGKANFRQVINEIAGEAGRVIAVLRNHKGMRIDLGQPSAKPRQPAGTKRASPRTKSGAKSNEFVRVNASRPGGAQPMSKFRSKTTTSPAPPTEKMVAFAKRLAADKKLKLPPGFETDFDVCRGFLDQSI